MTAAFQQQKSRVEQAVACFQEGYSCSQALLSTFAPQFGLDRELALKVSGPFGAGMGRMGDTCGAVTGAFMVIGLLHGRTQAGDQETKEKAYALVTELANQFRQRNGSLACRDLLGCDLSTPEGRQYAHDHGLSATRCVDFVRDAAEIIDRMLAQSIGS
jgi:C_GCAxxG_C_C family probable redox protein